MNNRNHQEPEEFIFSLFVLLSISYSSLLVFFVINCSLQVVITALSALLFILIVIAIEERYISKLFTKICSLLVH